MAENSVTVIKKIVVIGGSAGSLEVVLQMLPRITKSSELAIIIVFHRKNSSDSSLISLLASKTNWNVEEAEEKQFIQPGNIYLAPADYHLLIEKNETFSLDYSEKVNYSRPSIDVTFESAADVFGSRLIGILLSGANHDGAIGLEKIQQNGGYSIIQNPDTAEVAQMPLAAKSRIQPDRIAEAAELAGIINGING